MSEKVRAQKGALLSVRSDLKFKILRFNENHRYKIDIMHFAVI